MTFMEVLKELYDFKGSRWPYRMIFQRMPVGMPNRVRLTKGACPVSLDDILVNWLAGRLRGAERDGYGWVTGLPLPASTIKALVEAGRDDLPRVLKFLGDRRVLGFPYGARLRVQDTQRILKICRKSDDPEILSGAATVLVIAAFARLAEPEVIARLLGAAPFGQLGGLIFRTTREDLGGGGSR